MSFILDALRKSENERQRDGRPNIARIPDAVQPRRLPGWAIGTIALLGVCVVALSAAWWRSTQPPAAATSRIASESRVTTSLPVPSRSDGAARDGGASAEPPGSDPNRREPSADRSSTSSLRLAAAAAERERRQNVPSGSAAAPASDTAAAAATPAPAATASVGFLPSYGQSAAERGLPPLRLELHAYDEEPTGRFVFINGSRYVEGEALSEGPRLLEIRTDGAVLMAGGQRWLLTQQ